jgi:hypothetical protein
VDSTACSQRTDAKLRGMELRPYEYRDPGEVLTAVVADRSLSDGDMLLALVHDPSGDQRVLRTIRLDSEHSRRLDPYQGPDILAGYLRQLAVPMRQPEEPPRFSVMTISARRGLAVFGPAECACMSAWRYCGHLVDAFVGEMMVVTEHGWADFMSGLGGREPRLLDDHLCGNSGC